MPSLQINTYKTPDDAPLLKDMKGIELKSANIIYGGTEDGNPTYDLIFQDKSGNKYACLTTARILRGLILTTNFKDQ